MTETKKKIGRVRQYLADDVWDVELNSLPGLKRTGVKILRVLCLVFKGFADDDLPLHAAALTYNTLMAVVPMLALSLVIARGFGDVDAAKNRIKSVIRGTLTDSIRMECVTNTTAVSTIGVVAASESETGMVNEDDEIRAAAFASEIDSKVDKVFQRVDKISFAALGGFGLAFLLITVIMVLSQMEDSFNRVWGVKKGRPLWRKFTDYLGAVLILPFLLFLATSLPIMDLVIRVLNRDIAIWVRAIVGSAVIKDATVVIMTSLTFTFLIMVMPNTKVRFRPGLVGGFVAGVLFLVWLWLCIKFQIGVLGYGKIYGSFALLPILLAWLFISWEIVLLGAEVAFAMQNCATYRMEQGARRASVASRVMLAVTVVVDAARAMLGDRGCLNVDLFAREKIIPIRFLKDVVEELVQEGYLGGLAGKEGCYVLLKAPAAIRVQDIIDAVMRSGAKPEEVGLGRIDPSLLSVLKQAEDGFDKSLKSKTVQDLV